MNKDVYKGREATGVVLLEGGGTDALDSCSPVSFCWLALTAR